MATDDFNRANGGLGANWNYDNNWYTGPLAIASNVVPLVSSSTATYYSGTFANDQYSEVTLANVGSWGDDLPGVIVRCSVSSNNISFYRAYPSQYFSGYLRITRFIEDPYSDTALYDSGISGGVTFADGDVLRLEALDEAGDVRLNFYVNGVLKQTYLDTSGSKLTAGKPGMWMEGKSGSVPAVTAWAGGDLSTAIDGVATFTEPNGTLTGAGAVVVAGVGSFTEPVGTLTGVAAVANTGSAAFTEPAETLSSAVEVRWYAAAAFTEPGDALTSAVAVAVVGAVNASDPLAGTLTSAAALAGVATSAFTEPGESLSSDATVTGGAITADAAFTEPNETHTGAGLVVVAGTLANAEPNEAHTGVGAVAVVGTAAFTEAGESLSSTVSGSMFVDAAFTEPNETHTGAGEVDVAGSMQATEPNETHTGAGTVGIAGAGAFTEPVGTVTSAGLVVIVGTGLNNTEANEQLGSLVETGTGFVYGTHRRISIGIGMGL